MTIHTISILLALLSLVAGGLLLRATVGFAVLDRICAFLIPPLLVLCLAEIYIKIASSDSQIWNETRMARTCGLYGGVPLYPGRDATGPILGTLHTPLSHILFWPATFAPSPLAAVYSGVTLSVVLLLIALVLAHIWASSKSPATDNNLTAGPSPRLPGVLRTLFALEFFWLGSLNSTITSCFFVIHADPIAMVCGTISGGLLLARPVSRRRLLLSALFAVLAVASKQTFAALPIAVAIFVYFAEERQVFLRYCAYLAGWGLLAAAAILAVFHPVKNVIFNLFILTSHRPPQPIVSEFPHLHDGVRLFSKRLYHVVGHGLHSGSEGRAFACFLLLLCFWTWLVVWKSSATPPGGVRQILTQHRWLVFVLIGLLLFPLLFKASITIGGDQNHLAIADFFFFLGFTTGFLHLIRSNGSSSSKLIAHLLVFIFVLMFSHRAPYQFQRFRDRTTTLTAEAAAFSHAHPGVAYFPFNPLTSVYSVHRFYTFDHSIEDRDFVGYPITQEQYLSGIPSDVTLIALDPYQIDIHEVSSSLRQYLSQGWTQVDIPELKYFTVYRRNQP